jgi:hypothetical protein
MLEKMGPVWTASDGEQRREISQSLADIAVFDCTLGEARLAAKAGCKFCLEITNKYRHVQIADENNSDGKFFLASRQSSLGAFGVLTWWGKSRDEKGGGRFDVNDWSESLEILALSGKLTFSSKFYLSRPN